MITITQQPYKFTPLKQKLLVLATSDNVANTGFRYKVTVSVNSLPIATFYCLPNPVNALVFDCREVVQQQIFNTSAPLLAAGASIHSMRSGTSVTANETTGNAQVDVEIEEAWEVAGILTDDPDSDGPQTATIDCVFNASFQMEDGYRPNPATSFALTANTKRILSDRDWNTHAWDYAETFGFSYGTSSVFIPVFETDFGVLSVPIDDGTDLAGNDCDKVVITILKANGTTASYTESFTPDEKVAHVACYPANLNASTVAGLASVKPSANTGWRAIYVRFQNSSNTNVSQTTILYNATLYGDKDCRFDRVRLGWVNSRGGWDYFNFIKKNEKSVEVERKRYRRVIGNYGAATGSGTAFTFASHDRGLTEIRPQVSRFLTITSSWMSEGEFALMQSLVTSDKVEWLQDDGTVIPVLIEDAGYTSRRDRNAKLYNQTFRLRYANDLNT